MTPAEADLTLADLADKTGISERTIRYYIQFGLLAAPEGAGPSSRYRRSHLARLRLIRMLQDRHLPLNEIRKVIAQHSDREIERMVVAPRVQAKSSALDYIKSLIKPEKKTQDLTLHATLTALESKNVEADARSHWERIRIAADIELHVRRPLSKPDNRRLEELLKRARDLYPEGDTK